MSPKGVNGQYSLRGREDLHQKNEWLIDPSEDKVLRNLLRFDDKRIAKQIFKISGDRPRVSAEWFKGVEKDL